MFILETGPPGDFGTLAVEFFSNGWALASLLAAVIVAQWKQAQKKQEQADKLAGEWRDELRQRKRSDDDSK